VLYNIKYKAMRKGHSLFVGVFFYVQNQLKNVKERGNIYHAETKTDKMFTAYGQR
jgi:hypothetical protein